MEITQDYGMENKPKTTWQKIKFYFGICHLCGGKIKRWSWTKAYCEKCDNNWNVNGL